jgi:hypothetical protein
MGWRSLVFTRGAPNSLECHRAPIEIPATIRRCDGVRIGRVLDPVAHDRL